MTKHVERAPLTDEESAVCRRLKCARVVSGLIQADLAERVGITRVRLASYEQKRAPLRADIALRVCSELGINEEWLATGEGKLRGSWGLEHTRFSRKFNVDSTFLEFYRQQLVKEIARLRPASSKDPARRVAATTREELRILFSEWLRRIPDDKLDHFRDEMLTAVLLFQVDHGIPTEEEGKRGPTPFKM